MSGSPPMVHRPLEVPDEVPVEEHESPGFQDENSDIERGRSSYSQEQGNRIEDEGLSSEKPKLERTVTSSSKPVPVVKIPRSDRTGPLGRLTILYEAEEPKNYPRKIKWFITVLIAFASVTAPMGTSIIFPCLNDIADTFHTTPFVVNLSVALYMLSMAIFPLWWSTFSEVSGRRTVYLISFTLYIVFNIVGAFSNSIGMYIVLRMLSGGSSASVQSVGAGTVADIWYPFERGRGMSMFYIGPLCGPLFAPIIGGGLNAWLGWRSTQWFQVIYGACMLFCLVFFLPETHHSQRKRAAAEKQALTDEIIAETKTDTSLPTTTSGRPTLSRAASHRSVQSVKVKTRKWAILAHETLVEPLLVFRYLRFIPVLLTIYYSTIAFSALYFINISVETTFSGPPYNFGTIEVGLLYLSNSLGYLLVSLTGGKWVDKIMIREASRANRIDPKTNKLIFLPEDRLRENAWLGALLMPAALLWYGWSVDKGVYWFCPIFANFFYGCGSMFIFTAAMTMLTEFMPQKASNGVALNNCLRNIGAFIGLLCAEPAIRGVGNGWLFTILAVLQICSCPVIWAFRRYGTVWRLSMDKALRREKEKEEEEKLKERVRERAVIG